MTKFFIRILKFSGPYRNRVLSAAVFAFIKGVCVMMPLFYLSLDVKFQDENH